MPQGRSSQIVEVSEPVSQVLAASKGEGNNLIYQRRDSKVKLASANSRFEQWHNLTDPHPPSQIRQRGFSDQKIAGNPQRFPLRIRSSPDFKNCSSFQTAQVKLKDKNVELSSPILGQASMRIRSPLLPSRVPIQEVGGSRVFGFLSLLKSYVITRSPKKLDEQALNDFNMEVGIVSSRVEMWRYRLANERSTSTKSPPRSRNSSPEVSDTYWILIYRAIENLVQLIIKLVNSLFDGMIWLLSEMENRLLMLLKLGSHVVFPVFDVLVVSIWSLLTEFMDSYRDETEKSCGLPAVVEAMSNAFFAIRSLLRLGYAYRSNQAHADWEYTGDDSRPKVDCSPAGNIIKK